MLLIELVSCFTFVNTEQWWRLHSKKELGHANEDLEGLEVQVWQHNVLKLFKDFILKNSDYYVQFVELQMKLCLKACYIVEQELVKDLMI